MEQSSKLFDNIVQIIEDIGVAISEIIDWAIATSDQALELLAAATLRVGNSISYILSYLEHDFLEGIRSIVKGAIDAGYAVADLIVWSVGRTFQAIKEVTSAVLDLGVTLTELFADSLLHPSSFIENLMKALREIGKTTKDILDAAFVQPAEDAVHKVVEALYAIGTAVKEILDGALEISVGAVFTVTSIILELTGEFRPMSEQEIREARTVFRDALPYSQIHISIGSWLADLTSWFLEHPNGLGTQRIVHFPEGTVLDIGTSHEQGNYDWLMHELTHVWQGENEGPFYQAEALTSEYDYAEPNKTKEQTLFDAKQAGKHFTDFNPEQQADIVMDYYIRLDTPDSVDAWEPFIEEVRAA